MGKLRKIAKNKKVFLGGTCNESNWRDELVSLLKIDFFNPIVSDWDEAAKMEEIKQRKICDYVLYVITPRMTGVYSIAEVVDDSNKQPEKTLFCVLKEDNSNGEHKLFDVGQLRSLAAVSEMVKNNGAKVFDNLEDVAEFLNKGE